MINNRVIILKIRIPIILMFTILLNGCILNGNKNTYEEYTVEELTFIAESFIINNFKDVNKIELEEPYESPMGSMVIDEQVNGASISITFNDAFNDDFTISSYSKE